MKISGKVIDLHLRSIYGAVVTIGDGRILDITRRDDVPERFIMPGLIDAHVHIESSMATPGSFAVEAVRHGTVAVVTDPHEIANVMGIEGVRFMIEDARRVPLRFVFGAPSCVPATPVESSGARLDSTDVGALLKDPDIGFLSEMMNFPGVLGDDPEIMEKLKMARHYSKPVDGHAPGLTGGELEKYISAGISTDHECTSLEEAREKIKIGMKVLIREGSAARNLTALHALIDESPEMVMICSDDIHPDDLERGHIDQIFRKLLAWGHNLFDLIMVASVNPATHYRTGTGLLREGDSADFIVIDNLENFTVLSTFIAGREVFGDGVVKFGYERVSAVNRFVCSSINTGDIITDVSGKRIRIIEAYDGLLNTGKREEIVHMPARTVHNTGDDILKIVVKERYNDAPPAVGFVKGFGLKHGAMASSVAHDSHNIIAVGTNDADIAGAVNRVVQMKGGLAWHCGPEEIFLPLEIAGIISAEPVAMVSQKYRNLTLRAVNAGSALRAPYMTLSFMALLVIPRLKIGDRGLFDVEEFGTVPLFVD